MKLPHNRHHLPLIALIIADMAVFLTLDTTKIPSFILVIGFLLLSATIYYIFKGLFRLLSLYGIKFKRQNKLIIICTGLVSGLIALQSIGELALRDFVVIGIIATVFYLYTSYSRSSKPGLVAKEI